MSPEETLDYQQLIFAKLPPLSTDVRAALSRVSQQRFREISASKKSATALAAGQSFIGHTDLLQENDDYVEYMARGLAELAWVEIKTGLLDSAYMHLQKAFLINNSKVLVLRRFGHYFLLSGNTERSMSFYQYLLSERPDEYQFILGELDQLPVAKVTPTRNQLVRAWELREKQQGLLNRITSINDIYLKVDRDPKLNYTYLKELTIAQKDYRNLLTEYEGVPILLPSEEQTDTIMAVNLGNYSYYALFMEDFTTAVEAAQASLELVPKNWVYTNYAHGYLYQGDWAKARKIYEETRLKKDDSATDQLVLADALLKDFRELKAAGVWHKDVPRAAALILGRKLTKAEKKTYGKP
jgi:tetratricopeptide (TPR) repeat protein